MKRIFFILTLSLSYSFLLSQSIAIDDFRMKETRPGYGIEGKKAPKLQIDRWVDAQGEPTVPFSIAENEEKFIVLYCFQAWCPGCHSLGLPSLQKMTTELIDRDDIVFAAIQTVFEGKKANTYERMLEIQKEYKLDIPFGHDPGNSTTRNISTTMTNYKTGGTPWFIFIDKNGKVVFNDFHLQTDKAIEYLKSIN